MTWRTNGLALVLSIGLVGLSSADDGPEDDPTHTAERAMAEGAALRAENRPDANLQAVERFAHAARLWHEVGDSRQEAVALESAGVLLERLDPGRALALFQEALPLRRAGGDAAAQADVLTHMGVAQHYGGDAAAARDSHLAALALARPAANKALQAQILHNLGASQWALGEHEEALACYAEALTVWRELGDHEHEARTINGIGIVHQSRGELQEALDAFREALPLLRASGNRLAEGITLHNLGLAYFNAGDLERAMEEYQQALVARRAAGDRRGESMTLYSLAATRDMQADGAGALEYYRQALEIQRNLRDKAGQALTLESIGRVQVTRKELAPALSTFEEALRLAHETDDPRAEAATAWGVALAYEAQGRREEALSSLEHAASMFRAQGNEQLEIGVMHDVAKVRLEQGQLDAARTEIERAIQALEEVRSRVVSDDLRSSYGASIRSYYDLLIEALMRLHRERPQEGLDAVALATSERARARVLLDTLAQNHADVPPDLEPTLVARRDDLWRQLARKERERLERAARKETADSANSLEREVQALLDEYHDVDERLRASSPRYATLTRPEPLSLPAIQGELQPEDALVEYALGDTRSFAWVVTREGLETYDLPGRDVIQAAARRLHGLISQSRRRTSRGEAALAAAELGRMILDPLSASLGHRRLLLVADGALHYVPFAVLPDPRASASSPLPLLATHEIAYLPSVSSLAVIRQAEAQRAPAPRAIAVFSDPIFGSDDPRLRGRLAAPPLVRPLDPLVRSARESGLGTPARLRFSRREASAILALAARDTTLDRQGFDATRASALDPSLAEYRIVHFATHGLLDSVHPDLSGIVLSLLDRNGQPEDGFLRLHDVYDMRLNADLVVLSGCQTALGQDIRGEGLVGVARGFFFAGAPRVIASLWSVSDEATAALMSRFYRALLKEHAAPAAALRSAQLSVSKDARWHAPYYWAGFVLEGEWKPLP